MAVQYCAYCIAARSAPVAALSGGTLGREPRALTRSPAQSAGGGSKMITPSRPGTGSLAAYAEGAAM